jgi:hypothetical protein
MENMVFLSQAEIDYLFNCLNNATPAGAEIKSKLGSLPCGGKWLVFSEGN